MYHLIKITKLLNWRIVTAFENGNYILKILIELSPALESPRGPPKIHDTLLSQTNRTWKNAPLCQQSSDMKLTKLWSVSDGVSCISEERGETTGSQWQDDRPPCPSWATHCPGKHITDQNQLFHVNNNNTLVSIVLILCVCGRKSYFILLKVEVNLWFWKSAWIQTYLSPLIGSF